MLEPKQTLLEVMLDENYAYMHKLTHLHAWQFFLLSERLHLLIERPRDGKVKLGPRCKHDYLLYLFFCLKWLNDSNFF